METTIVAAVVLAVCVLLPGGLIVAVLVGAWRRAQRLRAAPGGRRGR